MGKNYFSSMRVVCNASPAIKRSINHFVRIGWLTILIAVLLPTGSCVADSNTGREHQMREWESEAKSCVRRKNPDLCTTIDLQYDLIASLRLKRKEDLPLIFARLKDANFVYGDGLVPLSVAIQAADSNTVAVMLKKGADPLALDRYKRWFLYDAILSAYSGPHWEDKELVECVRLILEKATQSGRKQLPKPLDGTVIFFNGSKEPNIALLRLFLEYGAEPGRPGNYSTRATTPIDAAIENDNLEAIRVMISRPSHINEIDLDERAFKVLVKKKSDEMIALFRSAGADPSRYINRNPKLLFDTLRRDGTIEELQFLLTNGANPNIKNEQTNEIPIFSAIHDIDKVKVLLKFGADVNQKSVGGMTPLSVVLSNPANEDAQLFQNQGGHSYNKITMAKLLLDYGAKVNIDNGGSGQWGVLGAANRQDKDIINLLVQRGATLDYKIGGPSLTERLEARTSGTITRRVEPGPITIAIEYLERDDIALALLKRDKKISQGDKYALLQAVRRGWNDVARALIEAGADPNLADAEDVTPLAFAERRRDNTLIQILKSAGAKPIIRAARPNYQVDGADDFQVMIANEIDDVGLFDPPRFILHPHTNRKDVTFALYGSGTNQFENVQCERSAAFEIYLNMNKKGGINVGVCEKEAKRVFELTSNAKSNTSAMLGLLFGGMNKSNTAELDRAGLTFDEKVSLFNSRVVYFPLVVVGHGVGFVSTAVLVPSDRNLAIIVQADIADVCQEGRNTKIRTPLCSVRDSMIGIAERVFVKIRKQVSDAPQRNH